MTHDHHTISSTRAGQPVVALRVQGAAAALTTLILSVFLGLLSGAVWMHAT